MSAVPPFTLPFALVSLNTSGGSGSSQTPVASWSPEPSVIIIVLAAIVLYAMAWRRARATETIHAPGYGRLSLFLLGMFCVVAALLSPIDVLGEQLLVIHMVQHLLLIDFVPICVILSFNKVLLRPVTRKIHVIERNAGVIASPVFAVLFYVGIMYAWHWPAAYDAALHNTTVHACEHICFSLAGFLYWWHVLSPIRARRRLTGLGPIAYMTSTKLLIGGLGIVLAFSTSSLYPFYTGQPHYWGLTPVEDQNMAGLVMALEQSVVMGIALVYLFYKMLTEAETEQRRRERYETVAGPVPAGAPAPAAAPARALRASAEDDRARADAEVDAEADRIRDGHRVASDGGD